MNEQKKNMRVLDALKKSDKVEGQLIGSYAIVIEGVLHWVDIATDNVQRPVVIADIGRDEWRPYPTKKEIRPERAGELWKYFDGDKCNLNFMTCICLGFNMMSSSGVLSESGTLDFMSGRIKIKRDIIHNQNGWKLIYSPDEEVMKELEGEKVVVERGTSHDSNN